MTGSDIHAPRRRRARVAATVASAVALTTLTALIGGPAGASTPPRPAPAASAAADTSSLQPIDFVVLVDESGSVGSVPGEIDDERDAAALLVQSEISPQSKAAVIGFGSAAATGQSAVDPVCPLTTIDTIGRQQLSQCVGDLKVRTDAQGNDTDFPNAIDQALATLAQAGDQVPKMIFMLTDGHLDVSHSPGWGDASSRMQNAQAALTDKLGQARQQQVQIWPLGFGPDATAHKSELDAIAAGAYQSSCQSMPSAIPVAQVVTKSADVNATFLKAFASARCAQVVQTPQTDFTHPTDLYVTIPPIATDGSLEVTKRDSKATVTFYSPDGHTVVDGQDADGSTFAISGQNGPVEALRVTDPLPGKWRIHLEDTASYPGQPISAAAIWQGVLRSYITVTPPSPQAGQQVQVRVRLQTRAGVVISDPADLAGITVSAQLTGDGFDPVNAPLSGDAANPGAFVGTMTVPGTATGKLSFVGTMIGQGVAGDQRPFYTLVASAGPPIVASATFDGHSSWAGGSVSGKLEVRNGDKTAHTLTLAPADLGPGVAVTVQPASVTVQPGSDQSYPFTVKIGAGTPKGMLAGSLSVTDNATKATLADTFFDIKVDRKPSFLQQWWWALLIAAVLLLLAIAVVIANRRHIGRNKELPAAIVLYRDGHEVDRLRRKRGEAELFFAIDRPSSATPGLRRQRNGKEYTLRRASDGSVEVRHPRGAVSRVRGNERAALQDNLELAVVEAQAPPRGGGPTRPDPRRPDPRVGVQPGQPTPRTTPYDPDL